MRLDLVRTVPAPRACRDGAREGTLGYNLFTIIGPKAIAVIDTVYCNTVKTCEARGFCILSVILNWRYIAHYLLCLLTKCTP